MSAKTKCQLSLYNTISGRYKCGEIKGQDSRCYGFMRLNKDISLKENNVLINVVEMISFLHFYNYKEDFIVNLLFYF